VETKAEDEGEVRRLAVQEMKWDDAPDELSGPVSPKDITRALEDENNRAIGLHKPGSRTTMKDGTTYEVQADGAWKKVDKEEG